MGLSVGQEAPKFKEFTQRTILVGVSSLKTREPPPIDSFASPKRTLADPPPPPKKKKVAGSCLRLVLERVPNERGWTIALGMRKIYEKIAETRTAL